jgi:hypothetical protein
VPVTPGPDRNEYDYNGAFVSAKRHVMQTQHRRARCAPTSSCRLEHVALIRDVIDSEVDTLAAAGSLAQATSR